MKILLVSYSRAKNYGGVLQAYALYYYLKMQGHDVMYIDYVPIQCNIFDKKKYVMDAARLSKTWGRFSITRSLWSCFVFPFVKKGFQPFYSFVEGNMEFTEKFFTYDEIVRNTPEADIYITGSDQVWNSKFNKNSQIDYTFYLKFVKDTAKKISYASSFGTVRVPENCYDEVKQLLSGYRMLSVREKSGQNILSSMSLQSAVVADPTILCDVKLWDELSLKKMCNYDYLLLYQIKFNKELYKFVKEIANKMGLRLIVISLNVKDRLHVCSGLVLTPSVREWLSYIRYASAVLTDSFHASIFSIIFKRPFMVNSSYRKEMSTRIKELLDITGLTDHELSEFDASITTGKLQENIDWENCDKSLDMLRQKSRTWLRNALVCDCEEPGTRYQ